MKLYKKTFYFVCSLLPLLLATTQSSPDAIYNWQTGPWGVCWTELSCGEGVEERTVWCGDYLGRPLPYRLCNQLDEPRHSRPCYQSCTGHWRTGLWSQCLIKPDNLRRTSRRLCEGTRHRNVSCVFSGNPHQTACSQPPPPATVACYATCPKACVVGPWSQWTPCAECQATTYRTRQVIVAPSSKGQQCPQLYESKQCNGTCREVTKFEPISKVGTDPGPKIKVSQWGECTLPSYRVHFADEDSSVDDEENLISKDAVLEITNAASILQYELLDNSTFDRITSSQLDKISDSIIQIGVQKRNVSCIGENGDILDMRDCHPAEVLSKRSCVIPFDCRVTQWSFWTTIQVGCVAPSGQKVQEIRTRNRRALILQKGDGVPCPHLLENHSFSGDAPMPCNSRYQWLASSWGPCLSTVGPYPLTEVLCGGGIQKRSIVCIRTEGQIPVDNNHCKFVEPPPIHQRCEVGCGRDCVVGPWSPWSICTPLNCIDPPLTEVTGFRRRSRKVIVIPSSNGVECPPLEEQVECIHAQCHQWKIGEWSDCLLDDLSQNCGPGRQSRHLLCMDVHGIPAPETACKSVLGSVPDKRKCQIPCPFDCVLAEWSSWTPCSRTCSTQMAVGYARRNTSILAPPGQGGRECPPPDELTEIKTCNDEPCVGAAWMTDEWQECASKAANCGAGSQYRNIYCFDKLEDRRLPSYRCSGLKMPKVKKSCEVKCHKNCSLSNWSEWSKCKEPLACSPTKLIVKSSQKRWRVILSQEENVDKCGKLMEERQCTLSANCSQPASWMLSDWSNCIMGEGIKCGTGYRLRDVSCVTSDGLAEPTKCLLESMIVPSRSEECFVFCNNSCSVSKWSEWSSCNAESYCSTAYFQRTRTLTGTSKKREACSYIKLMEKQACPCHVFSLEAISEWSQCILDHPTSGAGFHYRSGLNPLNTLLSESSLSIYGNITSQVSTSSCGVGAKYRSMKCVTELGIETDSSFCSNNGIQEEPCMVECSKNCLVGIWEKWSPCDSSCGAGIQIRYRQVVQKSIGDGRICPSTSQQRSCWGDCETKWIADGWVECQIPKNDRCGNGTQERTVKCVQTDPSGLTTDADDSLCDPRKKLSHRRTCRVVCFGECVLSEWSAWSTCHQNCTSSNERTRTRLVVRTPAVTAIGCPHLEEKEACLLNVACWKYSWIVGKWTSCIPLGHSSCGEGVRNRPISCVRSDGQVVHESFCSKEKRPVNLERWCYVDCPVDCSVTTWTQWDETKCSCGEKPGYMIRTRRILVHPSESGRKCPKYMKERSPCPYKSCYTWERGPWSSCYLHGGSCGHGVMQRNVSCRGPGEVIVANEKCLTLVRVGGHTWPYLAKALDLNDKDSCYVPCNGDCEITEWSNWSHCHRDCLRGAQGGTQTRSRVILANGPVSSCPADLWESRPCLDGPCLTFSWKIIGGKATCIRSDGLVVIGGCGDAPRPCNPPCTTFGSVCSPVGVCVCKLTFRPQYSENTIYHLTKCVPTVNFNVAKASPLSQGKYLPDNFNGWMFAMLAVGSAFVVFVIISVYVMCKTPRDPSQASIDFRRQTNLQERSA